MWSCVTVVKLIKIKVKKLIKFKVKKLIAHFVSIWLVSMYCKNTELKVEELVQYKLPLWAKASWILQFM